MQKPSPKTTTN